MQKSDRAVSSEIMETILITGAGPNGVTGRRIKSALSKEYCILSPGSSELDLTDREAVDLFFSSHSVDYVIHCAVIYPNETSDSVLQNLRMYFNLARHCSDYKKMFYLGSGAEYDKSRDISNIEESEIGSVIPVDPYGLYKYLIHQDSSQSRNIYNIRLFGTINPKERFTKNVISNLCIKAAKSMPLTLRRDCRFSFTDIDDVIVFIKFGLNHDLRWHDYNFVPSKSYLLSEIAEEIRAIANLRQDVIFETPGLNREYTGSNLRLLSEFNKFTPLRESLKKVFDEMLLISENVDVTDIDGRWKNK